MGEGLKRARKAALATRKKVTEPAPKRPRYRVLTWDGELQKFTPQIGVRQGPYTPAGLRMALKKLDAMGYGTGDSGMPMVSVEHIGPTDGSWPELNCPDCSGYWYEGHDKRDRLDGCPYCACPKSRIKSIR